MKQHKIIFILLLLSFELTLCQELTPMKAVEEAHTKTKKIIRKTFTHKRIKKLREIDYTKPKANQLSYFIFIPLVLFIFIMTILSVVGFLVLMISSFGNLRNEKENINSTVIKNNLTNGELLEILKLKNIIKERIKSNNNAAPGFQIF
jgi:hypothetical protein